MWAEARVGGYEPGRGPSARRGGGADGRGDGVTEDIDLFVRADAAQQQMAVGAEALDLLRRERVAAAKRRQALDAARLACGGHHSGPPTSFDTRTQSPSPHELLANLSEPRL